MKKRQETRIAKNLISSCWVKFHGINNIFIVTTLAPRVGGGLASQLDKYPFFALWANTLTKTILHQDIIFEFGLGF